MSRLGIILTLVVFLSGKCFGMECVSDDPRDFRKNVEIADDVIIGRLESAQYIEGREYSEDVRLTFKNIFTLKSRSKKYLYTYETFDRLMVGENYLLFLTDGRPSDPCVNEFPIGSWVGDDHARRILRAAESNHRDTQAVLKRVLDYTKNSPNNQFKRDAARVAP